MSDKTSRKPEIGIRSIEADIFKLASHYSESTLYDINQLLRIWGITALQHSALQAIYVYDPEDAGLPSGEIGQYLITRVPDLTRLLDRMAEKKWVVRERDPENRRVVRTRLTELGVTLVESTHSSMMQLDTEQLSEMSDAEKTELKRLLTLATHKKRAE